MRYKRIISALMLSFIGVVSASLEKTSNGWKYSTNKAVVVRGDGRELNLPAAHRTDVPLR